GVRSARWAGPDDAARNAALLERLAGSADRRAAFVCALAAVSPDGREVVGGGPLDGRVARAPVGAGGFAYGPPLLPAGREPTPASTRSRRSTCRRSPSATPQPCSRWASRTAGWTSRAWERRRSTSARSCPAPPPVIPLATAPPWQA